MTKLERGNLFRAYLTKRSEKKSVKQNAKH